VQEEIQMGTIDFCFHCDSASTRCSAQEVSGLHDQLVTIHASHVPAPKGNAHVFATML
jgi:hypothetical protein